MKWLQRISCLSQYQNISGTKRSNENLNNFTFETLYATNTPEEEIIKLSDNISISIKETMESWVKRMNNRGAK